MSFQIFGISSLSLLLLAVFSLAGCGSSAIKQRKEQRDKISQSSKLYCEFVNGEVYVNDIDVALNIEMGKRCDLDKPFTVTQYKTPSESQGLVYCCSMSAKASAQKAAATAKEAAKEAKKDDGKKADTTEEVE